MSDFTNLADLVLSKLGLTERDLPEITEYVAPPNFDTPQDSFEGLGAAPFGVRSGKEAIKWARAHMAWPPGYCLQWVRMCFSVDPFYPDANTGWYEAEHKHPVNFGHQIPRGVPVWWTNGSHGHVALSLGNGYCLSTDAGGEGHVAKVKIDNLTTWWGLNLRGWTADINGVRVYNRRPKDNNDNESELERIMAWYKNKEAFRADIKNLARAGVDSSKFRKGFGGFREVLAARHASLVKTLNAVKAAEADNATKEQLKGARQLLETDIAALDELVRELHTDEPETV